ncbi:MAG: hypothetical protein J5965_09210, partial [Aeriscardovia sp.]|nr:hypothetical protein [Aeriscardovia sp.]
MNTECRFDLRQSELVIVTRISKEQLNSINDYIRDVEELESKDRQNIDADRKEVDEADKAKSVDQTTKELCKQQEEELHQIEEDNSRLESKRRELSNRLVQVKLSDYRVEEQNVIRKLIDSGRISIYEANSKEEVEKIYTSAVEELKKVKTKDQINEEEQADKTREVASIDNADEVLGDAKANNHKKETTEKINKVKGSKAKLILLGVGAVLSLVGIFVFLLIPSKKYYISYTTQYGLPQGIGQISKQETKSRARFYEIDTYRLGKIVLSCRDSYGRLQNHTPVDYMMPDFAMTVYGNIREDSFTVEYYDKKGVIHSTWKYSNNRELVSKAKQIDDLAADSGEERQANISDAMDLLEGVGSKGNCDYKVEYDDNGYIIKELRYSNDINSPVYVYDDNGIYGCQYARDEMGRPVKIMYLDYVDGRFVHRENKGGYYTQSREYDGYNLVSVKYYDSNGNMIPGYKGCSEYKLIYDDCNNAIESRFFNADGELTISTSGYASCIRELDNNGNAISYSYFDEH